MATKARKKSATKTARKTAGKRAQVQLDPATVLNFETYLREGLVASGAVLMSTETPRLQADATVHLDSDAIQQVTKILRDGLVSSAAVLATDLPQVSMQTTRKTSKRKSQGTRKQSSRATSKKR